MIITHWCIIRPPELANSWSYEKKQVGLYKCPKRQFVTSTLIALIEMDLISKTLLAFLTVFILYLIASLQ